MHPRRLLIILAVAVASLGVACYDGPFAHANPNDPDSRFTLRLESTRDTISPGNPLVQFTLITEPATPGYAPIWTASIDTLVGHVANGQFQLFDLPEFPITVQIKASFMNTSTTRNLVLSPTP